MGEHLILGEQRTWPLETAPDDVDFRLLGRLLARKPWVPGLYDGAYSYADHLINLAEACPPDFKLEALLMFAHAPFDEPVAALMVETEGQHRFSARIKPICGADIYLNSARAAIRTAAGLSRHPQEKDMRFLIAAQSAVMQAELRDMSHGLGRSVYANAAVTKQPIIPRTVEAAAAIWADKVEHHIPNRMAARNPERQQAS